MSSAYSISSNDSFSLQVNPLSSHPRLYIVPHPEPAETTMVTEGIPVGPLMKS